MLCYSEIKYIQDKFGTPATDIWIGTPSFIAMGTLATCPGSTYNDVECVLGKGFSSAVLHVYPTNKNCLQQGQIQMIRKVSTSLTTYPVFSLP